MTAAAAGHVEKPGRLRDLEYLLNEVCFLLRLLHRCGFEPHFSESLFHRYQRPPSLGPKRYFARPGMRHPGGVGIRPMGCQNAPTLVVLPPLADKLVRMSDVTRLLEAANRGDRCAAAACSRSSTTSCGSSPRCAWPRRNRVTPSTLVHEAYLRPHHRLSQLGLCPGPAARRPRARALMFFVGQIGPRLRLVG
jgi:hypothetical protein